MITPTMMYWITRLDGLRGFLHSFDELTAILIVICLAISGVAGIICTMMVTNSWESSDKIVEDPAYKLVRSVRNYAAKFTFCVFLPINVLLSLAYALTPSMKEYCAIKVVPAIVNNEKVQEFGDELYRLGVDWLKELRPQDKATSAAPAKDAVEPKQ